MQRGVIHHVVKDFYLLNTLRKQNIKPTPIATPVKAFEAIAPATNFKTYYYYV
eukprot:UN05578